MYSELCSMHAASCEGGADGAGAGMPGICSMQQAMNKEGGREAMEGRGGGAGEGTGGQHGKEARGG